MLCKPRSSLEENEKIVANDFSAGVVGLYKTSTIGLVARDSDFTYGTAFPLIWLCAEVSATVIACSIPFYRPLVRLVRGKPQPSRDNSNYSLSKVSRPGTNPLNRTHDQLENDDSSDRYILRDGKSNILRQTDITVEHSYETDDELRRSARRQRGMY